MKLHVMCCRMMVACLFAGSALVGNAQNWKAPVDGSWGDGAKWEGDAVPGGTAPLAFTGSHAESVTVTLDGDRQQAAGMTFGGGDWRIEPGTPSDSALTFPSSMTITTLDGVATLAAPGTATSGKVIFRGGGEFCIGAPRVFSEFRIDSGSVRVSSVGVLTSAADRDLFVDGTGALLVDGGTINTKILRLGQETFPTNAFFRMTSGTVNCSGSGKAVLLVGYNKCGGLGGGTAVAEIAGGTFTATGAEGDAGVFLGRAHNGSLSVGGENTAAVLNCAHLGMDWQAAIDQLDVTNILTVGRNGTVIASTRVQKYQAIGRSEINLQAGGLLCTPTVFSESTGMLDFVFDGGTLELTGTSNTLFTGVNTRVAVNADSVLDIGAGDVSIPAPFSGCGTLTKLGAGGLSLSGSHAAFSGAWAVTAGTLALQAGAVFSETAAILLADGTGLDASGVQVLAAEVAAAGDAAITVHPDGTIFGALTLGDGTVTFDGDGTATLLALDVPFGTTAEISCAGHVIIGALTGGGTITVSGGGAFDVIGDAGFSGTISDAGDETVLNMDAGNLGNLDFNSDAVINTFGKTVSVQTLTLAGGTLQVTGGGELVVQDLLVTGDAAIVASGGDGVVTNIASLVIEPGVVFTLETQETVYIGAAQGAGTLQLVGGGTAAIAELHSGISFDIGDGEVVATPTAASVTAPAFPSGEPAFWVDASVAASLTMDSGKLTEWRDWRGGAFTMKATSLDVAPTVETEPSLGGKDAVRFASPHNYGTNKGMEWDQQLTNVRTVFWVIGAQEGGGQLLGDINGGHVDFLRGEYPPGRSGAGDQLDWPKGIHYAPLISQSYALGNRDHIPNIRNGIVRIGGNAINPLQTGYPHPGYHVVSMRTTGSVCAATFASERNKQNTDRSGCQRLAECIVFTNALTDAEIEATEAYLQRKWFGTDARAPMVRLGGATAGFTAQGGAMLVDELRVAENGPISVSGAVSGVTRVEQLTAARDLTLQYDAANQRLPLEAQSLRVENDAVVTVNSPAGADVWVGQISGHGSVAIADGASADVGSAITLAGESLKLAMGVSVPTIVRSWFAQGGLEVAGASELKVNFADISGAASLAVTGGTDTPLNMSIIRATGAWTLTGSVDPFIDVVYLYYDAQTWTLNTGGNDVRINVFHGRGTFTWHGQDQIKITGSIRAANSNNPILPVEAFVSPIPAIMLGVNSRSIVLTGDGDWSVNQFVVDGFRGESTCALSLAPDVILRVTSFQYRPEANPNGVVPAATLYLPTTGTLIIDTLQIQNMCPIVFPPNAVTAVRSLATRTNGDCIVVQGGTLQVTETINTCRSFIATGEGIIFPDGMALTPTLFDVRAPARVDLGEGSTLTLNIAGQTFSNDVTFARGAVLVAESVTVPGVLALDGTALSVAAGETLTATALGGDGTITLTAGAVLDVQDQLGFGGTIISEGGTLHINSDRTNSIPNGPVVEPTFWVDASESGSLETNSSGLLVWLDKRTVRDNVAGLMYATSSNRMPTILRNEMNGLPIVNFGRLNEGGEQGMVWSQRLTDVRAVHWVIGAQDGGGQMLGDINSYGGVAGHIDYFRYNDGANVYNDYSKPLWSGTQFYSRNNEYISNVVNGVTYMNGQAMAQPGHTEGFPSPDYHLLSLRTAGSTWAGSFASERFGGAYSPGRSGAQRLGEVLIYNGTELTERQNRENDAYLSWKWFARRLSDYRLEDEGLSVLRGSYEVLGENVLVREMAPGAKGLSVTGNLTLDAYLAATEIGAVIRLDTLPVSGTAAISVTGDVFLPSRVTVVLGEVQMGTFTVLDAGGTIQGSAEWLLDTTAVPNAAAYQISLTVQDNTVLLKISGKGTTLLLR